ncbi:hypothetical protein GCM10025867_46960 (plasmid) [Frondihabitans sucicola]|uniref:Uncharacterized protein n=2 Tax=Frondihabitans sucicola TaxID=1268041 RepID=A0ABM8GVQ2_9MICO|nr:hypothetical protein GCM10025867_46960 [Frondihabitans sucicola]
MPLGKTVAWEDGHTCGNCGEATETALARTILSAYYGSWEAIAVDAEGGKRWLCLPCGWTLRDKDLRRMPITITRDGTLSRPSFAELRTLLSERIPADLAVTLPIEGRKAVMADARWGAVATDSGSLPWTAAHRRALASVVELTSYGFTEGLLSYDAPPFGVLSKVSVRDHARVRELWNSLGRWRPDVAAWPTLVRLARRDKDSE